VHCCFITYLCLFTYCCLIKTVEKYVFFFIPVYNRPDELAELLESLSKSNYKESFEVVIVEDGSTLKCDSVVAQYNSKLSISYFFKANSGPGDFGISA
jgi:glycosyltransferase involved in cell wall biosynthesis